MLILKKTISLSLLVSLSLAIIAIQGCGPSQEELRIGALEHFRRGNELFAKEDPRGAINEYRMAIAMDESQAVFHFNMGLAYYRLVLYERSIEAYQTAIDLNPEFGEAWYNLSLVLDKIGETDRAFMAYEKYQAINQQDNKPKQQPAQEKPKVLKKQGKKTSE